MDTARMTAPRTGYAYLDDTPKPLAFAHRGGAMHPDLPGLENTMAAFRHAVSLGYRYLETDVHATVDGVLLAFHDEELDRVTDGKGALGALAHDEVGAILIGGREGIPTLAQLFDEFPRARFNIDIKSERAAQALAEFVEERTEWDRVLVGSFSPKRLAEFRHLTRDRVPTSATPIEVATVFRDFDDYWQPFTLGTGPAPGYCASLDAAARQRLEERLRDSLPRAGDQSIPLKARALAIKAVA